MAGQALGGDDPLEVRVLVVVAGRDVVVSLLSVPGDRGLGEEPVALDQERVAPLARAECVGDRGLDGGDGPAGVEPLFAVTSWSPRDRPCNDTRRRRTPPRPARPEALRQWLRRPSLRTGPSGEHGTTRLRRRGTAQAASPT